MPVRPISSALVALHGEASRDELERMFQASGNLHYGVKPVPGAGLDSLDRRRLRDYLISVPGGQAPADDDAEAWQTLLNNIYLMTMSAGLPGRYH